MILEFNCFADRTPDDVRAIVTADIALISAEIASICGDDRLVSLEAKRKSLQAQLASLRDPDTDEAPEEGDANYPVLDREIQNLCGLVCHACYQEHRNQCRQHDFCKR